MQTSGQHWWNAGPRCFVCLTDNPCWLSAGDLNTLCNTEAASDVWTSPESLLQGSHTRCRHSTGPTCLHACSALCRWSRPQLVVCVRMVTGCRPGRTLPVHLMKTSSPMHLLSAALPFQFQVNMERLVVIVDGDPGHDSCRVIHVAWCHYVFQTERYLLVCSCHGLFGFYISVPSALLSTWSNVVIGHRNHFRHVMWEACKLGPGTWA